MRRLCAILTQLVAARKVATGSEFTGRRLPLRRGHGQPNRLGCAVAATTTQALHKVSLSTERIAMTLPEIS